jgi:alanine-glyoxylate transaminase/serine-glyoxylate transaminase/serine-pyruvate transaminase
MPTSPDANLPRGGLSHGLETVAIPGPSIVPERVRQAMSRPMPDIYAGDLVDASDAVFAQLPGLVRTTEAHPFVVIGNGHAAWQMAICNTLSRGDTVLALESGRFATAWGEQAAVSGVKLDVLPGRVDGPVDPEALRARLADDRDHQITAVMVVQTDTATSVRNDIAALRSAIDEAGHPALLMVDCIASLACEPYEMDAWGVDVTVAASQKGIMVPPGVAFVWAGPKALEAHQRADLRVGYFDWGPRIDPEVHYQLYAGTPPVAHLYGLREALAMVAEEGLENRWRRHRLLAGAVWAAIEAWSAPGGIGFNIPDPAQRSTAVTTVLTGDIDAEELRRRCKEGAGVTLGSAIGGMGHHFRIGHMGHLNPPMLLGTLGTIEAGLVSMGAPMGRSGVAAAAAHLGSAMG